MSRVGTPDPLPVNPQPINITKDRFSTPEQLERYLDTVEWEEVNNKKCIDYLLRILVVYGDNNDMLMVFLNKMHSLEDKNINWKADRRIDSVKGRLVTNKTTLSNLNTFLDEQDKKYMAYKREFNATQFDGGMRKRRGKINKRTHRHRRSRTRKSHRRY